MPNPFPQAITELLTTNRVVLYGRIDRVPEDDVEAVMSLLKKHFTAKALGYPGPPPTWHPAAAEWATKVVFHAAQLLLYRSHEADALDDYFPEFTQPLTAGAMISADITLRYLPAILQHLEAIDVEDDLIPILTNILRQWHYSGLLADISLDETDLDLVLQDECLKGLYIDRIIETKNKDVAARSQVQSLVLAAMGDHADVFWNKLKPTT